MDKAVHMKKGKSEEPKIINEFSRFYFSELKLKP